MACILWSEDFLNNICCFEISKLWFQELNLVPFLRYAAYMFWLMVKSWLCLFVCSVCDFFLCWAFLLLLNCNLPVWNTDMPYKQFILTHICLVFSPFVNRLLEQLWCINVIYGETGKNTRWYFAVTMLMVLLCSTLVL